MSTSMVMIIIFFFFSSRRRHTRFDCDWSSDVCSSDLEPRISGWFGQREQFAFDPRALTFHDDARRFELGTPSLAAVYAQLGGLEYIEEIGVPAIRDVTAALTEDLIAQLRAAGFTQ